MDCEVFYNENEMQNIVVKNKSRKIQKLKNKMSLLPKTVRITLQKKKLNFSTCVLDKGYKTF